MNCRAGLIAVSTAGAVLGLAAAAGADVVGFVGDTTLEGGWYAFEDEFDVDMTVIHHGGAVYDTVYGIDVPEFNGSLDFDAGHSLRRIGYGWATWSHGYTGEVFYNNGAFSMGYDLNMDEVHAFDAYLDHDLGAIHWYEITAYGSGGGEATAELQIQSGGSTHFGFYAAGETIERIEIEGSGQWTIGEWRVGVPSPGVMGAFALAVLWANRRRWKC